MSTITQYNCNCRSDNDNDIIIRKCRDKLCPNVLGKKVIARGIDRTGPLVLFAIIAFIIVLVLAIIL